MSALADITCDLAAVRARLEERIENGDFMDWNVGDCLYISAVAGEISRLLNLYARCAVEGEIAVRAACGDPEAKAFVAAVGDKKRRAILGMP